MKTNKTKLDQEIKALKNDSDAMHAEYLAKRNSDRDAADYAWEMYQAMDLRLERSQAELLD